MKREPKALIDLSYFKDKDAAQLQDFKFYSAKSALHKLDRQIPREETDITITSFKVEDIISLKPVNTVFYAFCPYRSKCDECTDCSFTTGVGVDISSVLPRAVFDPKLLEFAITSNVHRRVTFSCGRHITPRFIESTRTQHVNQHKMLAELSPSTDTLKVYCWVPVTSTLEDLRKLYAGQSFNMKFRVTKLEEPNKVMVGTFTEAEILTNIHTTELDIILSKYMSAETKPKVLQLFAASYRLRKRDFGMINIKVLSKLFRELEWSGFISQSGSMYHRTLKLGKAIK